MTVISIKSRALAVDYALEQLQQELDAAGVKLRAKRGWFWSSLHWALVVLSLGRMRRFRDFWTTIGPVIAVPMRRVRPSAHGRRELRVDDLVGELTGIVATLRHERVHVRQQRWLGFGSVWLGLPLWGLLYLLVLPAGLAPFRYLWERQAYLESIRSAIEFGASAAYEVERRVDTIHSAAYFWPWPFKEQTRRWFRRRLIR